ncbi:MAG: hypothetical protein LBF50_09545 [Azoarcus sp.]|jgi:hypothetical protein|nr:hypothetical protein [Azoarcus sp.]
MDMKLSSIGTKRGLSRRKKVPEKRISPPKGKNGAVPAIHVRGFMISGRESYIGNRIRAAPFRSAWNNAITRQA